MDNRTIDVVSESLDDVELALRLVWQNAHGGKATHYRITRFVEKIQYYHDEQGVTTHHYSNLVEDKTGVHTLILYWHEDPKATQLPFPLDLDAAVTFVIQWLKGAEYDKQPDHDGENYPGWRVFNESWGHVAGSHRAIVAIQPEWAMHGK